MARLLGVGLISFYKPRAVSSWIIEVSAEGRRTAPRTTAGAQARDESQRKRLLAFMTPVTDQQEEGP